MRSRTETPSGLHLKDLDTKSCLFNLFHGVSDCDCESQLTRDTLEHLPQSFNLVCTHPFGEKPVESFKSGGKNMAGDRQNCVFL